MTLSVMLPTYNRLDSFKIALDSVLRQTRPVDEIVVADAGSTDGTIEYIEHVRKNLFPNINLVGAASRIDNWLSGISACTNEHVLILCDDDFIHRRLSDTFNRLLAKHPYASMYCFRQQVINLNYECPKAIVTKKWTEGELSGEPCEFNLIENGFPGFPSIIINKKRMNIESDSLSVFNDANYLCDLFLASQAVASGSIVFDNYIASTFYFHPHSQSITQGLSLFYPYWDQKIRVLGEIGCNRLAEHFKNRYNRRLFASLVLAAVNERGNAFYSIVDQIKQHLEQLNAPRFPSLLVRFGGNSLMKHLLALSYKIRKTL